LPTANLPTGHYRIEVGMYSPDSGVRLPAIDSTGRELSSDQFEISSLDWNP